MTQSAWRPVDGDEIVTTPVATPAEDDVHTAETAAAPEAVEQVAEDEAPVRASGTRPQLSWQALATGAILVLVALQVVIGFLALGSINQVRDQETSANGLQRCLINAQLAASSSSDSAAYATAVRACINK